MPDQGLTAQEAKIVESVSAATQYTQRLALGLAKKGHGFEIKICGKGDAALTVSYTVHVGQVVL